MISMIMKLEFHEKKATILATLYRQQVRSNNMKFLCGRRLSGRVRKEGAHLGDVRDIKCSHGESSKANLCAAWPASI